MVCLNTTNLSQQLKQRGYYFFYYFLILYGILINSHQKCNQILIIRALFESKQNNSV